MKISAKQLALAAGEAAHAKKALDTLVLDVRQVSGFTDYVVVTSARSDVHLRSVAESVEEALAADGQKPVRREGAREGSWILLDYVDVMVHVLDLRQRAYYNLEGLWKGAKVVARFEDL
jgi:ribosome-associated protein